MMINVVRNGRIKKRPKLRNGRDINRVADLQSAIDVNDEKVGSEEVLALSIPAFEVIAEGETELDVFLKLIQRDFQWFEPSCVETLLCRLDLVDQPAVKRYLELVVQYQPKCCSFFSSICDVGG